MLRALVLLLVLANAAFFAWNQGWLDSMIGGRAAGEREPERLARQANNGHVKLLEPAAASAALASAAASVALAARGVCLETGEFAETAIAAAEQALATLPAGSWTRISTERSGSYLVYMGKYPNAEALQKKEEELKRLKVAFEPVTSPAELAGGLSLGRHAGREAADAALAAVARQGVRTARLVTLVAPGTDYRLRIERANATLAAQVAALDAPALGGGFQPCAGGR